MTSSDPMSSSGGHQRRTLVRSDTNKMVAGVCAGISDFTGIDVTLVRLATALLAVFGGSGVVLYVVAWLVMPSAGGGEALGKRLLNR